MLGKTYLMTGGTSGLGKSLVDELISRGCFVIVLARNEEKLKQLTAEYPGQVTGMMLDMTNREAISRLTFEHQFDGFINNAGLGYFKSFDAHSAEEIYEILTVNLTNAALLLHQVLPHLRSGGTVINISSQAARVTTPYGAVYAASKAGLSSLANALRLEYPGLHFLTVQTGPIATNFFQRADESGRYDVLTKRMQLNSERLAEEIIEAAAAHRLEVNRPRWMHYGLSIYHLMPRFTERVLKKAFLSKQQ